MPTMKHGLCAALLLMLATSVVPALAQRPGEAGQPGVEAKYSEQRFLWRLRPGSQTRSPTIARSGWTPPLPTCRAGIRAIPTSRSLRIWPANGSAP
jgi:hypothetical protein